MDTIWQATWIQTCLLSTSFWLKRAILFLRPWNVCKNTLIEKKAPRTNKCNVPESLLSNCVICSKNIPASELSPPKKTQAYLKKASQSMVRHFKVLGNIRFNLVSNDQCLRCVCLKCCCPVVVQRDCTLSHWDWITEKWKQMLVVPVLWKDGGWRGVKRQKEKKCSESDHGIEQ